jgi:hypothetical protein
VTDGTVSSLNTWQKLPCDSEKQGVKSTYHGSISFTLPLSSSHSHRTLEFNLLFINGKYLSFDFFGYFDQSVVDKLQVYNLCMK